MSITLRPNQSWFSAEQTLRLSSEVLATLGTEVAQGLRAKLDSGDHGALASAKIDPGRYTNVLSFARDYQATNLVRKATFLKTGTDLRKVATAKFLEAERKCEDTNRRLNALMDFGPSHALAEVPDTDTLNALNRARELIRRIVGDKPKAGKFRFGPGATSLVAGSVTLPRKYSREIHVTPELYPFWRDVCGVSWCKLVNNVNYQSGCAISFVPKDASTDRTIGIEPHVNIYAQLAVGDALRQLFRPWIDLRIGQERNRALAQVAQRYGLSTIDFSSASDTVSRSIVWLLFPEEWAMLMDRVRSHRYLLDGDECVFHKHSSMGNGYTFELESIIFYALARAVCLNGHDLFADQVSVYGDDVILPNQFAGQFIKLAEYCGFKVNTDKSFLTGSFYESCGHDYFNGVNVRPKFWKVLNPLFGFKAHNDLKEMAVSLQLPKLGELADRLRSKAPDELKHCLISERVGYEECELSKQMHKHDWDYGDVGFKVPFDVAKPSVLKARDGHSGFRTKALKFRPSHQDYASSRSGLLAALDTGSMQSSAPVRGKGSWQVGDHVIFNDWLA